MRIAGMLRIKNEARWIKEVLLSLAPICDAGIFVFDDHSTDETLAECDQANLVLHISGFTRSIQVMRSTFSTMDEARDKDVLLDWVWNTRPSQCEVGGEPLWVVCIDGDEVLTETSCDGILRAARTGCAHAFGFQVMYLWDRPDQIRTDGIYGNFWRPSMFNATRSKRSFRKTGQGANFHCSNVPADFTSQWARASVQLKHYGYMDRAQRVAKFHWYNSIDPGNQAEDRYRHMVQGDVAEVPADATLKWAGPLTLAPWA